MTTATASHGVVPARRRPTTWVALALLAVALGMVGFMFASAVLPGHERLSASADGLVDVLLILASVMAFVSLPVVGAVLAIVRPRNPIGWLLLVGGATLVLGDFAATYVERSTLVGPLPGYRLVESLSPVLSALAIPLLTIWLPLLFPDGPLPGPRWRVVGALAAAYTVVVVLLTFVTKPDPPEGVAALLAAGLIAAAVVSLAVRFRRAQGIERQQMKWFLLSVALVVGALLLLAVVPNGWGWAAFMLALTFLPIAIGIAVLRYRLYDIDRLISRTIGWAIVSVLLVGSFAALVLGSSTVLDPVTGGNTLAVAGSTLVVAALFAPVRQRVQRAVDRRFDRARYDGERLIGVFGERLRAEVDHDAIRTDVLGTVDTAVRPASVGLWLREGIGER